MAVWHKRWCLQRTRVESLRQLPSNPSGVRSPGPPCFPPSIQAVIAVAQPADVHHVRYNCIPIVVPQRQRKLHRHVSTLRVLPIQDHHRPRHVSQPLLDILLLPRPPHSVQVGVMQPEDWIRRRRKRVAHLPMRPAHSKAAAASLAQYR